MTMGTDVSGLFHEVMRSISNSDLELKKLVYLYLINYARKQPEAAFRQVGNLQKDAQNPDPLVRALAIRTMGCIRIPKISECLVFTLKLAFRDKDDYVKKTAAVCTVKLFDIDREAVFREGFVAKLRDLIQEGNPMVVSNAVAALTEIGMKSGRDVFQMSSNMLSGLAAALGECNEWGQVYLLDALAAYEPTAQEAENTLMRIRPQLKHKNAAVSMSAIKVIMKYLPLIESQQLEKSSLEAMRPPLITLLNHSIHPPEIQYVALRNINLIIQRYPDLLAGFQYLKEFFCEYNDPIYVKLEKLEIIIGLAADSNIDLILSELQSYAKEADTEFVRKAVRAIGRCAIKLPNKAADCVKKLLELIKTGGNDAGVNYVVQEGITVMKDIFRKYPNQYEASIGELCDNLDSLDEPEAKASMIWIIGDYSHRIENSQPLLEQFFDNYRMESAQVQLATLTAIVKFYLHRPTDKKAEALVTKILTQTTQEIDNPDLRDRGFVYWRLLAADTKLAQKVVLGRKPEISDKTFQIEEKTLDVLLANINTLSSIFHKPPAQIVKGRTTNFKTEAGEDDSSSDSDSSGSDSDSSGSDSDENEGESTAAPAAEAKAPASAALDLIGIGPVAETATAAGAAPVSAPAAAPAAAAAAATPATVKPTVVLSQTAGSKYVGLNIAAALTCQNNQYRIQFYLKNQAQQSLSQFKIKFAPNFLSLNFAGDLTPGAIAPGAMTQYTIACTTDGKFSDKNFGKVQAAIKTELGVSFFFVPFTVWNSLFDAENAISDPQEFYDSWSSLEDKDVTQTLAGLSPDTVEATQQRLQATGMRRMACRVVDKDTGHACLYMSANMRDTDVLIEIEFKPQEGVVVGHCRSSTDSVAQFTIGVLQAVLA